MPKSDRPPAFQFYPKDFLSDPNVLAMDNRQVGVYVKLLSVCWMQDGLPADTSALARIVGESIEWMEEFGGAVLACFKRARGGVNGTRGGGRLHHSRLQRERKLQIDRHRTASESGKRGNEKRWGNQEDTSVPDRPPIANRRSSSSSPTPKKKEPPRSEENNNDVQVRAHDNGIRSRIPPPDFKPTELNERQLRARRPELDFDVAVDLFKRTEFPNPKSDWHSAFHTWFLSQDPERIARAAGKANGGQHGQRNDPAKQAADAALERARQRARLAGGDPPGVA